MRDYQKLPNLSIKISKETERLLSFKNVFRLFLKSVNLEVMFMIKIRSRIQIRFCIFFPRVDLGFRSASKSNESLAQDKEWFIISLSACASFFATKLWSIKFWKLYIIFILFSEYLMITCRYLHTYYLAVYKLTSTPHIYLFRI